MRQLSNGADAPSMFTLENVPEFAMSPSFGFVLLIDINGEHPGGGGQWKLFNPRVRHQDSMCVTNKKICNGVFLCH